MQSRFSHKLAIAPTASGATLALDGAEHTARALGLTGPWLWRDASGTGHLLSATGPRSLLWQQGRAEDGAAVRLAFLTCEEG